MIRCLEASVVESILICCVARKYCGNVKNDRGLLICQGILRGRLVRERIEPEWNAFSICVETAIERTIDLPSEGYLDMILIHGKPQIQQLQLTIVSIQQISSGRAIFPCTSHILPYPVECITLFRVLFWIIAVSLSDVGLQWLDPVDVLCLLQRTGDHW